VALGTTLPVPLHYGLQPSPDIRPLLGEIKAVGLVDVAESLVSRGPGEEQPTLSSVLLWIWQAATQLPKLWVVTMPGLSLPPHPGCAAQSGAKGFTAHGTGVWCCEPWTRVISFPFAPTFEAHSVAAQLVYR
jgi:hypothetical protein